MRNKLVAALLAACIAAPVFAEEPSAAAAPEPAAAAAAPTAEAPAAAAVSLSRGQTIYGPNGRRIGQIQSLSANGAPNVIVGIYFVEVPLSSLSMSDDRVVTNMTSSQLLGR